MRFLKVYLHWSKANAKAIFSLWSLSLLNVNIYLDSLWTHLEAISLLFSHLYKRTLNLYSTIPALSKSIYILVFDCILFQVNESVEWSVSVSNVVSAEPDSSSSDEDEQDENDVFGASFLWVFGVRLHQGSALTLRQCCDDASDTALIENNEIAPKWVATLF